MPTEFWKKAEKTLLLSELRAQSNLRAPSVDDVVISRPSFLPLCGNGKIDTKDDYATYYQDTKNLPLRLTRQQILFNNYGVTDPDIFHDVTVFEDEQCDDGNRVDFDGCSADCMYLDVWTSACELAVDTPLLVYEDIMYDTVRQSMVVSATTGIYTLDLGVSSLMAQLLAPKSIPVTNLFRYQNSLILYSAEQQAFWQLVDGQSEILLLRNLPQLAKWDPSYFKWECKVSPAGSVIVQDDFNLLYLKTPTAEPFVCPIGRRIDKCTFAFHTIAEDISNFRCESATENLGVGTYVSIGAGYCYHYNDQGYPSMSIWGDLFNLVSITSIMERGTNQYIQVSPAIPDAYVNDHPIWLNGYLPMGGFVQGTGSSARKLGSQHFSGNIFYFTGDPALIRLIMDENRTCSQEQCVFDSFYGYDALDLHPTNLESKSSWNDILQQCILAEAAIFPPLSDLKAIMTNSQRYTRLLLSFAAIYGAGTQALEVTGMDEHPITHNIWAVRKDRIIEVSKSGVLLQREDGKCIPSGVALCPPCQWAPNGQKCKPCSDVDAGSLAWSLRCKGSCLPSSGRRLLAEDTVIRFVLSGNFTTAARIWPAAVKQPNGDIYVDIFTQDPVAEMKRIQTSLLALTTVGVLTRPYVVIPVDAQTSSDDNTGVVVAAVLVPSLVLVVGGVLAYVFWYLPRVKPGGYDPLLVTGGHNPLDIPIQPEHVAKH